VKISILSCFGDIALAIGPAFEPYLGTTMGVLKQAGLVQFNPVRASVALHSDPLGRLCLQLDYELVDYVNQLREGILEAYTGIISGFRGTDKGWPFLQLPMLSMTKNAPF
jgi:importin subunit beta-1